MRRKTNKRRTAITRALLKLLHKLLSEIKNLQKNNRFIMPERFDAILSTIKKVYKQQYLLFSKGENQKAE